LRTFATNWNLAFALFFQLLLSRPRWSNNLTYEVYTWVFRVRNVYFFLLFWWFVIWWRHISFIHTQNFIY
jgi:hypothetical protein